VRVVLILNPAASSYREATRSAVEQRLRARHDLVVEETRKRQHATDLAEAAAADGADVVVVLAGDGTLNEAAAGLLGTRTALAPLPGGSTNVFARTLGVPYDAAAATDALLRALDEGSFHRVGVGVANGRSFLFHLGAGFDAAVVSEIEERPEVKRHLAHPAFALAAVDTWIRRYDRRTRIRVEAVDTEQRTTRLGEGPYVVVSNSSPYTYVSRRPVRIAPQAGLDRPLALTLMRTLRASVMLRAAASSVATTRFLTTAPEIVQVADLVRITLAADRPFPWQVDGEYLGEVDELDVRYRPDALTLAVPAR
jgi:diacylglycerol kinase family enzyme